MASVGYLTEAIRVIIDLCLNPQRRSLDGLYGKVRMEDVSHLIVAWYGIPNLIKTNLYLW